ESCELWVRGTSPFPLTIWRGWRLPSAGTYARAPRSLPSWVPGKEISDAPERGGAYRSCDRRLRRIGDGFAADSDPVSDRLRGTSGRRTGTPPSSGTRLGPLGLPAIRPRPRRRPQHGRDGWPQQPRSNPVRSPPPGRLGRSTARLLGSQ